MAQVVSGNQVKLSNGQTVAAQQGGWYDGQQFWGGSLSNPGQINTNSNQQGAGQQVSNEVVAQTNPNNVAYIQKQQQQVPAGGGTGIPAGGGTDVPAGGGGTGIGISPTATLNLPDLYSSLEKSAGIHDLQDKLTQAEKAFNDNQSKINDNPFLSEADRVGRVQKLQLDYNNDTKSIGDELAMKKADIQTQLDLQTKQFDINSQSAKAAMDQFNTLLQSGALDNASGADIAGLTAATGMSSGMIQSAIAASVKKNTPTQVISFDDGTNQGFAIINPQTGAIISKQTVAASKPTASSSGVTSDTKQIDLNNKLAPQYATQAAKVGKTLPDMMATFQQYGMTPQQIYDTYNAVNYYKATPAQQKADKKTYNVK